MKRSNKTKMVGVHVTEDLYNEIQLRAENEKLSVSSFLNREIKNMFSEYELPEIKKPELTETEDRKAYVSFDKDTSAILQQKAAEQGLTETAYLRNLIHTKDFKVYRVVTDDLENIIEEVHSAISSLSGTISIIRKQGQGKIFEQDVKHILQDADEIKKTLNKIVQNLYKTRRSTKNKILKDLENQ